MFILCPLSLKCRLCQNMVLYCIPINAKMEESQPSPCVRENSGFLLQCVSHHKCLHFLHKALCFWHFPSPKVWRLTKLGESYLHFLFKVMTKDTGEQPDEDIYRVRSGRVLNSKASVPMELGVSLSQCGWLHQSGTFRSLYCWDFYGNFLTYVWSMIDPTSSPSPLSEGWQGADMKN